MTADELLTLQTPDKSTELVRGRLVVREPPSTYHGRVQATLNLLVAGFVRTHRLGAVFGQDTGFRIASDPDGYLDGEAVLPGFTCAIDELIAPEG